MPLCSTLHSYQSKPTKANYITLDIPVAVLVHSSTVLYTSQCALEAFGYTGPHHDAWLTLFSRSLYSPRIYALSPPFLPPVLSPLSGVSIHSLLGLVRFTPESIGHRFKESRGGRGGSDSLCAAAGSVQFPPARNTNVHQKSQM